MEKTTRSLALHISNIETSPKIETIDILQPQADLVALTAAKAHENFYLRRRSDVRATGVVGTVIIRAIRLA